MKRVILLIFYAMISVASLHADNEPDIYFEGLGYNIMSKTDLTCEIGKSSYGGEVITRPTVEYQGKTGSSQILVQSPNFYMKEQYF